MSVTEVAIAWVFWARRADKGRPALAREAGARAARWCSRWTDLFGGLPARARGRRYVTKARGDEAGFFGLCFGNEARGSRDGLVAAFSVGGGALGAGA